MMMDKLESGVLGFTETERKSVYERERVSEVRDKERDR